ncbi:MAG: Inner rane lipoprotein yiaD, partial [Bacteroidota bacterium]
RKILFPLVNILIIPYLHTQNPENLGVTINSMYQEGYPLIAPDGQTLYYTRLGHPLNVGEADLEDVWMSVRQAGDTWSAPINLSAPINNREPNIIAGINIDGNQLFLKGGYERNAASILYLSRKSQSRVWSAPRSIQLGEWRSKAFSENYTVNAQGNIAICAFESPPFFAQKGQTHLHVSLKNESSDTWSTPQSLGTEVNKDGKMLFGFLAPDDKTLYFNKKHNNENHIYVTRRSDDTWQSWSTPILVETGGVLLTDATACSVSAAGDYLYFNAMQQEEGTMDLYRVWLPEEARPEAMVLITGSVLEGESTIENAPVRLQFLENGKTKLVYFDNNRDFKLIIPKKGDILFGLEIQNGYAETVVLDASNTLSVEPDNDMSPWTASIDPEIEQLELKIATLDRHLQRTEVRRSTEQNRVYTAQIPLPTQPKKRSIVAKNSTPNPAIESYTPNGGSPEMQDLKNKYNKIIQNSKQNTDKKASPAEDSDDAPSPEPKKDAEVARLEARLKNQNPANRSPQDKSVTHQDTLSHPQIRFYIQQMQVIWSLELQSQQLETVRETLESELPEVERYYLNGTIREKQKQLRTSLSNEQYKRSYTRQESDVTADYVAPLHLTWRVTVREAQFTALKCDIHYTIQKSVREKYQSELATRRRDQESAHIQGALSTQKGTPTAFGRAGNNAFLSQKVVLKTHPAQENEVFPLNGVFFNTNTATLRNESVWELELLIRFLEKTPHLGVEIRAHTNGHCSQITAQTLTESRAKAVGDFLKAKNIAPNRVETRGIGKNEPLISNDSAEGRRKNQRIEVRLFKI